MTKPEWPFSSYIETHYEIKLKIVTKKINNEEREKSKRRSFSFFPETNKKRIHCVSTS